MLSGGISYLHILVGNTGHIAGRFGLEWPVGTAVSGSQHMNPAWESDVSFLVCFNPDRTEEAKDMVHGIPVSKLCIPR